jgi:hypothetical protein
MQLTLSMAKTISQMFAMHYCQLKTKYLSLGGWFLLFSALRGQTQIMKQD